MKNSASEQASGTEYVANYRFENDSLTMIHTEAIHLVLRKQDYDNEAAVRMEIADRLLHAKADGSPYGEKEGATYQQMIAELDSVDKGLKRKLGIADGLSAPENESLYESARSRMEKTVETICEAYRIAKNLTGDDRKAVRKELLVEFPRTKSVGGKMLRYRDPDYSVLESGDYQKYLEASSKPVKIKIHPSAKKDLAALQKALNLLEQTQKNLVMQFVNVRIAGNRRLLTTRPLSWAKESLKNLEEAVAAVERSKAKIPVISLIHLLLSYAALLLLIGETARAKQRLTQVLNLCKGSLEPSARNAAREANRLLNQLMKEDTVILVYTKSLKSLQVSPTPAATKAPMAYIKIYNNRRESSPAGIKALAGHPGLVRVSTPSVQASRIAPPMVEISFLPSSGPIGLWQKPTKGKMHRRMPKAGGIW